VKTGHAEPLLHSQLIANMTAELATDFLVALADSANRGDYDAHMNLLSRQVTVHGVPGFDIIGYEDWARQCQHEFENGLLKQVSYAGMKVLVSTPTRVMFKTMETVEGTDGTKNRMGVEIVIEKEEDGAWRITQERILPPEEARHDGLDGNAC